jgi:tRNA (guanine37-N1)-methyltransferase
MGIPPILTSGDHGAVARWRHAQALRRTMERRPDLMAERPLRPDELRTLEAMDEDAVGSDEGAGEG